MTKIERVCQQCGKIFYILVKEYNKGRGKYCSLKCVGYAHRKGDKYIKRICQECGRVFYITLRQFNKNKSRKEGGKYCSNKCVGYAQTKGGKPKRERVKDEIKSLTGDCAISYLKRKIKRSIFWNKAVDVDVPPELVELKRAQLNLYREARKCLENSRRLTEK